MVSYPIWIANFPQGCGVDKPRGWLKHLVENKALWDNVVRSEGKANGDIILRFPTKQKAKFALDSITGVKAKNGMV